jgi:hypothetical protein
VCAIQQQKGRESALVVSLPGFLLGGRSVVVGPGVVEGGAEAGTEKETEQKDRQSV